MRRHYGVLHPNGFKIRLLQRFWNGMRLRLHWWPNGSERLNTPHDHRSWFISIPLWGSFIEKRYREIAIEPANTLYTEMRCESTTDNGAPKTTQVRSGVKLKLDSVKKRYPLVPYLCPVDAIHSYMPAKPGFAASLVLFGAPIRIPRAFIEEQ